MKKTPLRKISDKQKEKIVQEREERKKMYVLFEEIFNERNKRSEISKVYLGKECLSTFCHHILPKNKYKSAALDKENIILVTFEEHEKVERDPFFFEEVNKRRELLKEKYQIQ